MGQVAGGWVWMNAHHQMQAWLLYLSLRPHDLQAATIGEHKRLQP
jgi:hypothetical protein